MRSARRFVVPIAVALVLGVMALMMALSSMGDSVTCDEVPHIVAGYTYLTKHDYRVNIAHPPLIKDLAALPLLAAGVRFPERLWNAAEPDTEGWALGDAFLYGTGNDPDRMALLARLPNMLLSLLLGLLVFAWSSELFGTGAGVLGLVLYAFSATVLAHSRLVTMDLGTAFFMVGTMYLLHRFLDRPTWPRLLASGAMLGGAILTKLMAVLLAPAMLFVLVMLVVRRGDDETYSTILGQIRDRRPSRRMLAGTFALFIMAALGALIAYLVYVPQTLNTPAELLASYPARYAHRLPDWLDALLRSWAGSTMAKPLVTVLSTVIVNRLSTAGHTAFLLGAVSKQGWWYYYPVAIALKTELPIFLLAGVALLNRRNLKRLGWFDELYLLAVPIVFLAAGMLTKVDLGVRYMLPAYPFVFISLARCAALLDPRRWDASDRRGGDATSTLSPDGTSPLGARLTLGLVAGLLAWYVVGAAITFPHFIAYYNELAGGYRHGSEYLRDSNADWGQDIKRLAEWAEDNGVERIYVDVFYGPTAARHYLGDRMTEWSVERGRPDGLLAVSVNQLMFAEAGRMEGAANDYRWLEATEPIATVGGSIRIYDCREPEL